MTLLFSVRHSAVETPQLCAAASIKHARAAAPARRRGFQNARIEVESPVPWKPRSGLAHPGPLLLRWYQDLSVLATTRRVDRGISSIWPLSASGPPRLSIALCRGIGKKTFFPGRTTH